MWGMFDPARRAIAPSSRQKRVAGGFPRYWAQALRENPLAPFRTVSLPWYRTTT